MYYDDQGRRYNLLSGFVFGALLGAGIGMLLPRRQRRTPLRRARKRADAWAREAAGRAGRTGERARETLAEAVRRGAARARV
ncbi:hypothetical protein BH20GEM2_BH20GEM2_19300 [soil metagenome]